MKRYRLYPVLGGDSYQSVRDNAVWSHHVARVYATAAMIAWLKPDTICDPACGDASVVSSVNDLHPIRFAFLNDISAPQIDDLRARDRTYGSFISTGEARDSFVPADVIILTEILEHVDDPDELLRSARIGRYLVASSPLNEKMSTGNHEHTWGWDRGGYRRMLEDTGWKVEAYQELSFFPPSYTFGIWVCS